MRDAVARRPRLPLKSKMVEKDFLTVITISNYLIFGSIYIWCAFTYKLLVKIRRFCDDLSNDLKCGGRHCKIGTLVCRLVKSGVSWQCLALSLMHLEASNSR